MLGVQHSKSTGSLDTSPTVQCSPLKLKADSTKVEGETNNPIIHLMFLQDREN